MNLYKVEFSAPYYEVIERKPDGTDHIVFMSKSQLKAMGVCEYLRQQVQRNARNG